MGSTRKRLLSRFCRLLWPRDEPEIRIRVVSSVILVGTGKLVLLSAPFFYKRVVDTLAAPGLVVIPVVLVVAYGSARLITEAVDGLRQLTFIRVAQRAIRVTATDAFRHLHSLSFRYHLDRKSGGIAQVVTRGTTSIEFLIELVLFTLVPAALELLAVAVILGSKYDIRYAVAIIATASLYICITIVGARRQVALRRTSNALDVQSSITALDSLLNYETVKLFSAEQIEIDRYDAARQRYEASAIRAKQVGVLVGIAQVATLAVGSIVIMLIVAGDVADDRLTVGDFVLVNTLLLQLYVPLEALAIVYGNVRQSYSDAEAMLDLFALRPEVNDRPGAPPLVVEHGRIRFESVSFAYDQRNPVLRDVSFEVRPGHRVAIVGPSGGGKSTIVRLLTRFYDVDGGSITIDDADIRSVTQHSLRQAIGIVAQDTVLFNDTVASNIGYGRAGADERSLLAASRVAQLDAAIANLPEGYRTVVGERGLKLSGGEKQRLAIARVILKAAPILVFDEATSALDTLTERDIQQNLDRLAANRTTLIIAHRLSSVVSADEILVLVGGRIIERGRHEALLGAGGYYASLWSKQRRANARRSSAQ